MSATPTQAGEERTLDAETLKAYVHERVLLESTTTGSVYLLGTIHDQAAIVHLQRTLLTGEDAPAIVKDGLDGLNYFSAHASLARKDDTPPDLQIKVIWPASELHVRKHSMQERVMVQETPEVYRDVVVPYMDSLPADRIDWVYQILDGRKEAERVIFRDTDPDNGFLLTPDLKWDQTSVNAMYLTAIVYTRSIRSMRDLTATHIPLLRAIRDQAKASALEHYGVNGDKIRMFVHYQPSYYHFHVHIAHIYHEGLAGMMVGQAHLLDDIISLLEVSPANGESIFAKMTFTYPLGVEHKLYPLLMDNKPIA